MLALRERVFQQPFKLQVLVFLVSAGISGDLALAQSAVQTPAASTSAPAPISLDEAIRRAEQNEPIFAAALAEQRASALGRSNASAALLPSVVYHNNFLY